ncbi:peptidase U32 family protein [Paenibacillus sp. IHBB 10380]|uniref:peptidase U32 family protein n=1 Tax=Paenibacillus sp. IHBB 10380 TaxID=1566358 RepID=UPI0005CFC534|nr:U32 family peptidase [Paenibacillus sp. IHBB 10380]AJS61049.1 peptidase U32 [Paenibacillus sp. IHBB 10380]
MTRIFNGKEIELLAPVGTFDIFKEVIQASCDAVYFGGPSLNMRMMRKGYNFTLEEIVTAAEMAHALNKKVYVTVNNLLSEEDVEEARAYLQFLEQANVDAILVQDYAILMLIKEMKLDLTIHSSVMMNVHNLEMVRALKELGVARVVASREMDLQTARYIWNQSGIELEYFIHGDMCVADGANCSFSSVVFGMSGSRGKCMKPCRWEYRVKKDGYVYPTDYPMAVKDMYMYENIPELIESGICSFKIEGRMRDLNFILSLVNSYGDAIDRYIEDPIGFNRTQDSKTLYDNRKRDFSTAYAFGKPGLTNINRRYEGTGKFYSTGKVFSTPTAERALTGERVLELQQRLLQVDRNEHARAELAVRVNNMDQARMVIEEGADHLYLSGDVFLPDVPFTKKDIAELSGIKGQTKLYLGLPRMMTELHFEQYSELLSKEPLGIDGILVTSIGAIHAFADKGYAMIGDVSLNIYNHLSAEMYANLGVTRLTLSGEMTAEHFAGLLQHTKVPLEAVVHGTPTVMYMDHDLYENTELLEPVAEEDNQYVDNSVLVLMTDKGENPVYRDQNGRNHLTSAKELCYLPMVTDLAEAGLSCLRIEGATYAVNDLRTIIRAYKSAMEGQSSAGEQFEQLQPVYAGYTLGALQFN